MNTTLTGEAPACASKPRTPVSREHFEAMLQDDALISAADSALVLQARAEIVTEIVLGYQTRLLAESVTLELRSKLLDLVLGTLAKKLDPHKRFGIPKPEQKNGAFSNAAA